MGRILEIDKVVEKGAEFMVGRLAGEGSWGRVYQAVGGGGEMAFKMARGDEPAMFARKGEVAERCLQMEVDCGLRQAQVGIPPVLGLVRVNQEGEKVKFSDNGGGELAVAMPYFPPETSGLLTVSSWGEVVRNEAVKQEIMVDIMQRVKAMHQPVEIGKMNRYGSVESVTDLIVDQRVRDRADDSLYPFCHQAKVVSSQVPKMLSKLKPLVAQRLMEGKFGEQHGDPRPENIMVVQAHDRWQAPILDAVRLAKISEAYPEGRLMEEWYMTDIIFQAGLVLGTFLARKGYQDWFRAGFTAYERVVEPIRGREEMENLFGVALLYGQSVEAHVLGYRWDFALAKWQRLVTERGWQQFADWPVKGHPEEFYENAEQFEMYVGAMQELHLATGGYSLLTLKGLMRDHWVAMEKLASDFSSWKGALDG